MVEKKQRFKTVLLIIPIIFGMLGLAAITWPLLMLAGAVGQLGLPPEAMVLMVVAVAGILDIVALMKLFETRPIPSNRVQWLAFVLIAPYIGSTMCLFKELNPSR